jgi:hypothetical protein
MESIGQGSRTDIDSQDALAVAAGAEPVIRGEVHANPFNPYRVGDEIIVTPDDYGAVPVTGKLLVLDHHRVVIERTTDALGRTALHFPRIGFRVDAQA